jgi:DNA-binding transcriptional ArsR family regulator
MSNLDLTFSALSDATRRTIVSRLKAGELTLSELADPFDMSLTAVSKHIKVLSDAGLVSVTKRGRTRYCRLQVDPMKSAVDWLNDYSLFWEGQLESLARHLNKNGNET